LATYNDNIYQVHQPVYETHAPNVADTIVEDAILSLSQKESEQEQEQIVEYDSTQETDDEIEYVSQEVASFIPEPEENLYNTTSQELNAPETAPEQEQIQSLEPPLLHEPKAQDPQYENEPDEEDGELGDDKLDEGELDKGEDEPYDPIHLDRTAEILTALASANTAEDVNGIIHRFEFSFVRPIWLSTGEMLRFYVTNEGSGDILIGTTSYESGAGWRMRFKHYINTTMPLDIIELFSFMEQY